MKPLVSICCITYNHKKYIRKAINSLLDQKTDFSYEIVIHDDASTDGTDAIVREYEKSYPNIIKPIYQIENQYSKGKKITLQCVLPYVKGDYLAFCEGDDYWKDTSKLQKQIDFLLKNRDYGATFHGVEIVDINCTPVGRFLGPLGRGNRSYSMKDNIRGGFIHVSSLVMKSDIITQEIPKWALESRHTDYALAIIASAHGKVHFIDEIMSVHREGVENSVTTNLINNYSIENEIKYHNQRIETINKANKYYDYKFDDEIKTVIYDSETKILLLSNQFGKLLSKRYRIYFKEKRLINIIKWILLTKAPRISRKLSFMRVKVMMYKNRIK